MSRPENSVLAALPRKACAALLSDLAPVTLAFGDVLYEPGARMRDVYFPGRSVVSLLTVVDDREALEVGLVGREGMVGIPLALRIAISSVRALVQGEGSALKRSAGRFRKVFDASPPLQHRLHRHAHELMVQITQTAACSCYKRVRGRGRRELGERHPTLSDVREAAPAERSISSGSRPGSA